MLPPATCTRSGVAIGCRIGAQSGEVCCHPDFLRSSADIRSAFNVAPGDTSDRRSDMPMDLVTAAAAEALAAGDPLAALNRVALRDDAPALALRGTALAQLGALEQARRLLRRAARAFGPRQPVARARCVVAEAEIAVAARDLASSPTALDAARAVLEACGDHANAAHARSLAARRLLLIGRPDEAERALAAIDPAALPAALRTGHALAAAGIAIRRLHVAAARSALRMAEEAARQTAFPALMAEVDAAWRTLEQPAARLIGRGAERSLRLAEVEAVLSSGALVVDACRNAVRDEHTTVSLARRPVLFALARALGEAWPADVTREALLAQAFGANHADESHRARLRVEAGRLRAELRTLAGVTATRRGFALAPHRARDVVVLAHPVDTPHPNVLALLCDGEAWSSSSLAIALDASQRSVQRALEALAAAGRAHPVGAGRARRWMTPPGPGFATPLLLPPLLTHG